MSRIGFCSSSPHVSLDTSVLPGKNGSSFSKEQACLLRTRVDHGRIEKSDLTRRPLGVKENAFQAMDEDKILKTLNFELIEEEGDLPASPKDAVDLGFDMLSHAIKESEERERSRASVLPDSPVRVFWFLDEDGTMKAIEAEDLREDEFLLEQSPKSESASDESQKSGSASDESPAGDCKEKVDTEVLKKRLVPRGRGRITRNLGGDGSGLYADSPSFKKAETQRRAREQDAHALGVDEDGEQSSFEAHPRDDQRVGTDLHRAAASSHVDLCRREIHNGVPVNIKDRNGNTPLHWAVRQKDLGTCEFLVEKKADVRARNHKNATPLHKAAGKNRMDISRFLIEQNADIHAQDHRGNKPIDWAMNLSVREGRVGEAYKMLLAMEEAQ